VNSNEDSLKKQVRERILSLSDEDLLSMLEMPTTEYTPFALEVAHGELEKRGGIEGIRQRKVALLIEQENQRKKETQRIEQERIREKREKALEKERRIIEAQKLEGQRRREIRELPEARASSKGSPQDSNVESWANILIGLGAAILFFSIIGYFWAEEYLKAHPFNGLGALVGRPDETFSMAVSIYDWSKTTAIIGGLMAVSGFIMKAVVNKEPPVTKRETDVQWSSHSTQQVSSRQPGEPSKKRAGEEIAENIKRIAELRDSGILTDEEYQAKKKELLNRL